MNIRRYQKWAKSGLAIMLAGAMMVGTAASGGGMTAQAAETESSDTVSTQKAVTSDAASLLFTEKHITSNLTLPTIGASGTTISWKSSNPSVLSNEGKVTRPKKGAADEEVTLKGTVKMGDYAKARNFTFVVLAESEMGPTKEFALDQVELLDDYYLTAQNSDIEFLKKFDNDRLLSRFRETAGLDTKKIAPYGGWEDGWLGGHSVGHYLTAIAQAVKATGNADLKEKSKQLIKGLAECQNKLGTGFIFGAKIETEGYVEKQFDILEGKTTGKTWVPWYNMHKMLTGLVDTYKYTGNKQALEVAKKLGDWIYNRVSKWDAGTQGRVLGTEYGGMNDCLYELYLCTRDSKHLEAAHKFDEPNLYKTVAKGGKNCLNGKHANTTIPKFLGALKRYVVLEQTGELTKDDEVYLTNVEKFFDIAVTRHAYITGGVSVMEHFRKDNNQDGTRTQTNCESCCAHNMLKMAKELYKVTGDKKYADYYETTLRNSIMGAVKSESGAAAYFIPMATGYFKTFGNEDPAKNMFWCCTGSGMENFTKLGDSIYFHANDTLIVNQYVSSKVTWEEKNLVVTQKSDVTKSDKATFTVNAKDGSTIPSAALALRVPDWMHGKAVVTVNGQEEKAAFSSGGYILLEREWKDGDVVTMEYPMSVDAFGLPDNNTVFAFRYGPTVLAARLGKEKMTSTTWAGANLTAPLYKVVGDQNQKITIKYGESKAATPLGNETLTIQEDMSTIKFIDHIDNYLVKDTTSGTLAFKLKGTNADTTFNGGLQFVPFNKLNDERYGIYWYFDTKYTESDEKQILTAKENGRLDASILDSTQPGYGQYETDVIHQLQEKDSVAGTITAGGSTRYAKAGGYFTYNFIVNPDKGNALLCQFAKEDNGKTIKVMVGDKQIASKKLAYDGTAAFYTEYINIPDDVLKKNVKKIVPEGDTKEYNVVSVRFESGSDAEDSARLVGGLYMTQSFSDQAVLNTLTSSAGEVSSANDTFTIVVPKGTTSVALKYGIADQFGLLYVNDKLVDDTKQQTYELTAAPLSLKVKVYAEDHKTVRNYSVVIKVKEDDVKKNNNNTNNNSGSSQNTAKPKSSNTSKKKVSISITGKKSVKKGKTITLTVKKKNVKGKAKWSVNKKKLAKLKKKSATKVVLKARKKGKVKVTVKVGKLKATKTITIK